MMPARQRSQTASSADRERRASIASVSSAMSRSESFGSLGSTENSGRVRMTILKSPPPQTTISSTARQDTLTSPSSFSNPLGSPMFNLDLGLMSPPALPARSTSPLPKMPAMPNEHYNEQRVYDELHLSAASVSPLPSSRVSPLLGTDIPLSPPRRAFLNNQVNASPPKLALEPVEVEEVGDEILLPFADRPAEVAELMQLTRNKWVFDSIKDGLSSRGGNTMPSSPSAWTWIEFQAHILSPRTQVPDKQYIELAQLCLKHSEVLWERFRTVLGIELEDGDDTSEAYMRSPIQIDTLCEGDSILDSQKAGEEVQRHLQSPTESPRSGKRHSRGRPGSAGLSTSRSVQSMEPISESEDAPPPPEFDQPLSPGSGRVLGLRMIAAASPSTFFDLPNLARSVSQGSGISQGSSLPDMRDREQFGSVLSDDYALLTDDEGESDSVLSYFKPTKISSGIGPALPSLQVLMA